MSQSEYSVVQQSARAGAIHSYWAMSILNCARSRDSHLFALE